MTAVFLILTSNSFGNNKKIINFSFQQGIPLYKDIANRYMELNPDVEIKITVYGYVAYSTVFESKIVSKNIPDIFVNNGSRIFKKCANAGLLKDLSKELNRTVWGNSFPTGSKDVFKYNGKYYGAPVHIIPIVIWYNKKIFAKYNIKQFETWDDLLNAVKILKDNGEIPIALGQNDKWPGFFWWEYLALRIGGKSLLDNVSLGKDSFMNESFIQAGDNLMNLINLNPFQDDFLKQSYTNQIGLISKGNAAMELMGPWALQSYEGDSEFKKAAKDDIGVMMFPIVKDGKGGKNDFIGGVDGLVVSKNASKETMNFLKYATSWQNSKKLINSSKIIPATKGNAESIKNPQYSEIYNLYLNSENYQIFYETKFSGSTQMPMFDVIYKLYSKEFSAKKATEEIQKIVEKEGN